MERVWSVAAAGVFISTGLATVFVILAGYLLSQTSAFRALLILSWPLAATCTLAGLSLTEFPLANVDSSPIATLSSLGSLLRRVKPSVADRTGELRVQLGRVAVARILVRPAGSGSRVTYRMDFTSKGVNYLLLACFGFPPAAIPCAFFVSFAVRRFAVRQVVPLLGRDGTSPEPQPSTDKRTALARALAENRRLASEAYDAERSAYSDANAVVLIIALIVLADILAAGNVRAMDPESARLWLETSFGVALACGAVTGLWVRRRFRPRIVRLRALREALQASWFRDYSHESSKSPGASLLELLLDSWKDIPEWLDAVRHPGLSRDPAIGLSLATIALWAVAIFPPAVLAGSVGDLALILVAVLIAVGFSVLLVPVYRWLTKARAAERAEELAAWTRRFGQLRSA